MIEVFGDFWEYPARVKCITTNGYVKLNGEAVMGRGIALQAALKFPMLPGFMGQAIRSYGNIVLNLGWCDDSYWLLSFPVKHHWSEKADLKLIERSAEQLSSVVLNEPVILLPRPGCGNGQLSWNEVKPVIANILDNRFHVITFP